MVYQRRSHLRVKDMLVVALQEAICDSYKTAGVHMPPSLSNLLDRQAERAQRRQKRAERVAGVTESTASIAEGNTTARSDGDKRFRFRDELDEDVSPTGGVGRLLKTLKDPMGWKEQEMRTALLQDEHEVDDEEGRHVPKHRSLKPSGGILKGSNDAASPTAKSVSAAAQMSLDPKMQQGVVRVKERSKQSKTHQNASIYDSFTSTIYNPQPSTTQVYLHFSTAFLTCTNSREPCKSES